MAPFWSRFAIGMAIGIPILLICVLLTLFLGTFLGIVEGLRSGQFAAGWKPGQERAARVRARGEERPQRILAWMERYRATRWYAHLNRRLFG
jgi:hypothetical protein